MKYEIDLRYAKFSSLELMPEAEGGKRWSYSFVYSLIDLRNVAIALSRKNFNSFKEILDYCNLIELTTEKGNKWTIRSLEEIVNALRNFELVEQGKFSLLKKENFHSEFVPYLTDVDATTLRDVFMNYFRFRDFLKLYDEGDIVYSYIESGRFFNRFFVEKDTIDVQCLSKDHSDTMRFWDVFTKWGVALGILEKYPAKPFGISTNPKVKSLSLSYKVELMPEYFSPFEFADRVMNASFIYIPDLIFCIISRYKFSIKAIMDKLIYECKNDDRYRAQSASGIFIQEKEKFLIPKINNTYLTHLLKI